MPGNTVKPGMPDRVLFGKTHNMMPNLPEVAALMLMCLLGSNGYAQDYTFEHFWPQLQQPWYFGNPWGVASDSQGNVSIVDSDFHRDQVCDRNGTFRRRWGSLGNGNGQFYYPSGIAVGAAGNVFVADTVNDRIQVFNSQGSFLRKWGSEGDGDAQFVAPSGVTVDASGNVIVADSLNSRIQAFDPSGKFLKKWGSVGGGGGQFNTPVGIAIDAMGDLKARHSFGGMDSDDMQEMGGPGAFVVPHLRRSFWRPVMIPA